MQAIQASCGGNGSHIPRVPLSGEVPDGGHAGHALGTREQQCAPLLQSWGTRSRMRARVAAQNRPPGKPLEVRRIVDRMVPIHRSYSHSTYRASMARQGRGDGSFRHAERPQSDAQTADLVSRTLPRTRRLSENQWGQALRLAPILESLREGCRADRARRWLLWPRRHRCRWSRRCGSRHWRLPRNGIGCTGGDLDRNPIAE